MDPGHLTPEDFFEFIDQGGGSGLAGHHLMGCPECPFELDFLLPCKVPVTPPFGSACRVEYVGESG